MHNYDRYTIWLSVREYLVIYALGDGKGLEKLGSHDGIIILSTCSYWNEMPRNLNWSGGSICELLNMEYYNHFSDIILHLCIYCRIITVQ